MTFRAEDMLDRVDRALAAELARLGSSPDLRTTLPGVLLPPAPEPMARIAVVATDAGNLELRLHPLRVGVVRVATSDPGLPVGEAFVPLSAPTAEQLAWVLAEPSFAPIRVAAEQCGLDLARPDAWLPRPLHSGYSLSFLRELLEWLLLVHVAGAAEPGTLLLRDGLLRSVALPREAFAPIGRALQERTTARRLLLCAVAKRAPGGPDFLSYLELAASSATPGVVEVPPAVEERFSPATYASLLGRRLGALFLLQRAGGPERPMAVEVPVWQRAEAPRVLAMLLQHARGGFPEPGYPPELLRAHLAARVSPVQREMLARAFLRRLGQQRPELRHRMVQAHLTGADVMLARGAEDEIE